VIFQKIGEWGPYTGEWGPSIGEWGNIVGGLTPLASCTEHKLVTKNWHDVYFAVVHDCDVILSWNFSDIVKDSTRGTVRIVNAVRRYKEIEILSPEQFLGGANL
jgi:hypothetical protein